MRPQYRILLIDDDPQMRKVVAGFYSTSEIEDFEVEQVQDFDVGIRRAKANGIDLVLLDMGLPGVFGLDGLARFKRECPNLTVIVFTGRNDPECATLAVLSGAEDYIIKPLVRLEDIAWFVRCSRNAILRSKRQREVSRHSVQIKALAASNGLLIIFAVLEQAFGFLDKLINLLRSLF